MNMDFHLKIAEMMRQQLKKEKSVELPVEETFKDKNDKLVENSSESIPMEDVGPKRKSQEGDEGRNSDLEPDPKRLRIDDTSQSDPPSPLFTPQDCKSRKESSDEKAMGSPGGVTISAVQLFEGMLENNPENRIETLTGLIQTLQQMKEKAQEIVPTIPQASPVAPPKKLNMEEDVVVLEEISARMKANNVNCSRSSSANLSTRSLPTSSSVTNLVNSILHPTTQSQEKVQTTTQSVPVMSGATPATNPQLAARLNGSSWLSASDPLPTASRPSSAQAGQLQFSGQATLNPINLECRSTSANAVYGSTAGPILPSSTSVQATLPQFTVLPGPSSIPVNVLPQASSVNVLSGKMDVNKIPALAAAPSIVPTTSLQTQQMRMNPPQMVQNSLSLNPQELMLRAQQQQQHARQVQLQNQQQAARHHQNQQQAAALQRHLQANPGITPQQLQAMQMEQLQKQKNEENRRTLQQLQHQQLLYQKSEQLKKRVLDGINLACGGKASPEQLAEYLKQPFFTLAENDKLIRVPNPFLSQLTFAQPQQPAGGLKIPPPTAPQMQPTMQPTMQPAVSSMQPMVHPQLATSVMLPPQPVHVQPPPAQIQNPTQQQINELQQIKMQRVVPQFRLPQMQVPQGATAASNASTPPTRMIRSPNTVSATSAVSINVSHSDATLTLPTSSASHMEVPKSTPQPSPRRKAQASPQAPSPAKKSCRPSPSPMGKVPLIVETEPRPANQWSIFQLPLPTHLHVQCNCFEHCQ